MLIVPLILSSIIIGISDIGSGSALSKLGGKTLLYYAAASLIAIMIGLPAEAIGLSGCRSGAGYVSYSCKCIQRFLRCCDHCAGKWRRGYSKRLDYR